MNWIEGEEEEGKLRKSICVQDFGCSSYVIVWWLELGQGFG